MTQPAQPEYRRIQLTKGQFAIIDLDDVERLNCHCWHAVWSNFSHDYIISRSEYIGNRKSISIIMAREIMHAKDGEYVDHINGDPKDNRKANLRITTQMQNSWDRKGRIDSGQLYKGVVLLKSKWYAGIGVNWKQIRTGPFATPEEARDEYIRLSKEYHQGFGCAATEKRVSDVTNAPILERATKKKTGVPLRARMVQSEDETIRYIPLTCGQFTIVDPDRYEEFSAHNWNALWSPATQSYYASRTALIDGKWTQVRMHCVVIRSTKGQIVDHKNRNSLDNRLENLRIATRSQNMSNRKVRKDSRSGLKGVSFAEGRWMAAISFNNKRKTIGRYPTAELAYEAYCKAALELHGEFACLE